MERFKKHSLQSKLKIQRYNAKAEEERRNNEKKGKELLELKNKLQTLENIRDEKSKKLCMFNKKKV